MAYKILFTNEETGETSELTPEEFATLQDNEKNAEKAARYVEQVNTKANSVKRQNRLIGEREAAVLESQERRDRFASELAELLENSSSKVLAGFVLRQNDDGVYEMVSQEDADALDAANGSDEDSDTSDADAA